MNNQLYDLSCSGECGEVAECPDAWWGDFEAYRKEIDIAQKVMKEHPEIDSVEFGWVGQHEGMGCVGQFDLGEDLFEAEDGNLYMFVDPSDCDDRWQGPHLKVSANFCHLYWTAKHHATEMACCGYIKEVLHEQ